MQKEFNFPENNLVLKYNSHVDSKYLPYNFSQVSESGILNGSQIKVNQQLIQDEKNGSFKLVLGVNDGEKIWTFTNVLQLVSNNNNQQNLVEQQQQSQIPVQASYREVAINNEDEQQEQQQQNSIKQQENNKEQQQQKQSSLIKIEEEEQHEEFSIQLTQEKKSSEELHTEKDSEQYSQSQDSEDTQQLLSLKKQLNDVISKGGSPCSQDYSDSNTEIFRERQIKKHKKSSFCLSDIQKKEKRVSKKNHVKNLVKAFRRYLTQWGDSKQLMSVNNFSSKEQLEKLQQNFKKFEKKRNYNNKMLKCLYKPICQFNSSFSHFLFEEALIWLPKSNIQDKENFRKVIEIYQNEFNRAQECDDNNDIDSYIEDQSEVYYN